jgi:hypothetical protein
VYDMFLNAVFVKGLFDITVGRVARWGHVQRAGSTSVAESQ